MPNIGRIKISDELLLGWLQFPTGEILDIRHNEGELGIIGIVIEHYEMPEAEKGFPIPNVMPQYTTYQDGLGNRVTIREPLNNG